MVRDRRKYAFNPPKIRFHPNTKLPTNATDKLEKQFLKDILRRRPLSAQLAPPADPVASFFPASHAMPSHRESREALLQEGVGALRRRRLGRRADGVRGVHRGEAESCLRGSTRSRPGRRRHPRVLGPRGVAARLQDHHQVRPRRPQLPLDHAWFARLHCPPALVFDFVHTRVCSCLRFTGPSDLLKKQGPRSSAGSSGERQFVSSSGEPVSISWWMRGGVKSTCGGRRL
jgi:hypothetical protein